MFFSEYIPFGLDISQMALRLVQIRKRGKKNIIISQNEISLPKGTIVDGVINDEDEFLKALNALIKTAKGKKITTNRVVTVLPESKSFMKIIKVKKDIKRTIEESIEKEIPRNIPLSEDEMYFDWQTIDTRSHEDHKHITALIGAAPKSIIKQYTQILYKANLLPYIMEIEGASITRCLFDKNFSEGPKIIIDFGAARTGFILYDKEMVQFSISLPFSGSKITDIIATKLKIKHSQAEKAKRICGLDEKKCEGSLKKIMFSTMNDLAGKIEEAIDFYNDYFDNETAIKEIILTGGGANFINIDKVLSKKLKIPVTLANPLTNIDMDALKHQDRIPNTKLMSFVTAIGLALRGANNK